MEHFEDGYIDFSKLKKPEGHEESAEPFFKEPVRVEFEDDQGNPIFYEVILNFVSGERQIIVMVGEEDNDLAIVEAVIKDGNFHSIKAIESDEEYKEIVEMTKYYLAQTGNVVVEDEATEDE